MLAHCLYTSSLCWFILGSLLSGYCEGAVSAKKAIVLRTEFGVPNITSLEIGSQAQLKVLARFQERFPEIRPIYSTGLMIPGRAPDFTTLMQIAGDIAPDILQVNFRRSDTYIRNGFLYPLDRYIEDSAGATIPDGHLLSLDNYLTHLRKSPRYHEVHGRIPRQCWPVMRRECPYGLDCPYLVTMGKKRAKEHFHVWCFPEGARVMALFYRKDLFAEAGLPDRAPRDWNELMNYARTLTHPQDDRYGLRLSLNELGWSTLGFLYSAGGRVVTQDHADAWRCTFDSEEAVDAYYFVARLFLEPFDNRHGRFSSVVATAETRGAEFKTAMLFQYVDQRFFRQVDLNLYNFGPMPAGPRGNRAGEFNCHLVGIYAGLFNDEAKRDAAWKFIYFYDSPESRLVQAKVFVENGGGRFVQPAVLRAAGYPEFLRLVPREWEEANRVAMENGIPEPYGQNCQMVYSYLGKAIDQIRTDSQVKKAILARDPELARDRIRNILHDRVIRSNERMLGILTPRQKQIRLLAAYAVVAVIVLAFAVVFRRIFRLFTPNDGKGQDGWQFIRYRWVYLMLLPALMTIGLWAYYPLLRGSIMAFQEYNVRGFSRWIGMDNFANVLFDDEFWFALWVSIKYTFFFMLFGFGAPIGLALLLTEVPRGKILFRTIAYLPAVLTGVVVIFLWKGFYGQFGMINRLINAFIALINYLTDAGWSQVHFAWLEQPQFALFFCLLPTIWAGMGPGCLIYLAALKTIPDELYEAADIDGAGLRDKIFSVTLPGIKSLILINFIGAMVGAMKSGSEFVLAMTGGGPYNPYGQTEVVGLHIYWQAFGYLRFGTATAMAWILGTLLIGFTVFNLQKVSRLEFKATGAP